MGIFGSIAKAGFAKRAVSEARKPRNQQKIKSLVAKFRGSSGRGGTGRRSSGRARR